MTVRVVERERGLAVVEPPGDVPDGWTLAVHTPDQLRFVMSAATGATPPIGAQISFEREIGIRAVLDAAAFPRLRTSSADHRHLSVDGALGVSLERLLEAQTSEGGALDPELASGVLASIADACAEVHMRVEERVGRVDARSIWLSWDGEVRHTGALDLAAPSNFRALPVPFVDVAEDLRALGALAERMGGGARPPLPDETMASFAEGVRAYRASARAQLPGVLAQLFPEQRQRDLEWLEELLIDEITAYVDVPEPGPTPARFLERVATVDDGRGPALYVTDLFPRSFRAHARMSPHELGAEPITNISFVDAMQLIDVLRQQQPMGSPWRLPTSAEWDRLSEGGGVGRPSVHGVRSLCRVWELTTTPRHGGVIVRGGRWRDKRVLPRVENVSWDNDAAPDIGFRAVRFVDPQHAPDEWEPRT